MNIETSNTFTILESNLFKVEEQVEKYNRKAEKLNQPTLNVVKIESRLLELPAHNDPCGIKKPQKIKVLDVTIDGVLPVVDGWQLVARIDTSTDAWIPNVAPGKVLPVEQRHGSTFCDHCNVDRHRKDVFVLVDENDTSIRVGRNCLADFIRSTDAASVFSRLEGFYDWAASVSYADDEDIGREPIPRESRYLSVLDILARAAVVLRVENEFVSGSQAYNNDSLLSTASLVKQTYINDQSNYLHANKVTVTDDDIKLAEEAREWLRNLDGSKNDYYLSLSQTAKNDYVPWKSINILTAGLASFQKDKIKAKSYVNLKNSVHVGSVKDKVDFWGKVQSVRYFDGYYGTNTQLIILGNDGNVYGWYASKSINEVSAGDDVHIRGTVKKHDTYKGIAQTWLTRAKIVAHRDNT